MLEFAAAHPVLAMLVIGFLAAGAYIEAERRLLPLRIPAAEINALANQLVDDFGPEAADIALWWQQLAAHRMEYFEEGKWRRVRKCVLALETASKQ